MYNVLYIFLHLLFLSISTIFYQINYLSANSIQEYNLSLNSYLSINPFIYTSMHLSIYQSIYLSIFLSLLFTYLFILTKLSLFTKLKARLYMQRGRGEGYLIDRWAGGQRPLSSGSKGCERHPKGACSGGGQKAVPPWFFPKKSAFSPPIFMPFATKMRNSLLTVTVFHHTNLP